ncbi:DNA mismatch repair protein MutS [Nitrosovibrio sp. Nv17]|uniref:MutS-related protein n=1 Tax=Nitrosovibrio sp. Nv17 TaxID=1855339 RepID=UPI000908950C|nr:DNA mismatch repair protein MutS [Nitrosovibrio sp. Nv17]SFW17352.1 MutS domain V [Nitrosovibrio sp. Nv17]
MHTPTPAPAASGEHPPILARGDRPAGIRDTRPGEGREGVLDARTFDAIEVDALFDSCNHAATHVGQAVLYRSLARPSTDPVLAREKQEALRELESEPGLQEALQNFIKTMAGQEHALHQLLYGTFTGGLAVDGGGNDRNSMEFSGYGYHQYVDGTGFVIDMVESIDTLPPPRSTYLQRLFGVIRDFGASRIYSLMRGPVYPLEGKFRTREEKPRYSPALRFTPSLVKPLPVVATFAALGAALFFFQDMLASFGLARLGYGLFVLAIPVLAVLLIAIAASDRDTVIYPLRKLFRQSPELGRALDALGMLDELLSFRRYAQGFGGPMTLPEIVEHTRHLLIAAEARNPLLGHANPDYVPNDIRLDDAGRVLVITGPNSGGKTAYCKTVAQLQLLGQVGCYMPAATARLVPAEHIFYQVPDPGKLDEGMGRFGHELKRTREIFFNSTARSLVVLDELSEGTTFEEKMELSEYVLTGFHQLGASTLLVTHNHELCERLQGKGIGRYLQGEFGRGGPTHRLVPGISRVSHADRVAAALGFSKEDVEKHLATRTP